MPKAMTGVWIGLGGALILCFLVVGALLPRPYSETPIWNIDKVASTTRESSEHSIFSDAAGKGETKRAMKPRQAANKNSIRTEIRLAVERKLKIQTARARNKAK